MRRRSTSLLIVMMFVLSLVAPIPSAAQAKPEKAAPSVAAKPGLGDFDDFVNQPLKDWKVPGVAVAVVQGDKVILLKGYGYRISSCFRGAARPLRVKDQSGVTIEFKRDASGKVTEAALNDNGTAIVLKKK